MRKVICVTLALVVLFVFWVAQSFATMGCSAPSAGTVTSSSDELISQSGVRLLQISYTTGSGTFTCITNQHVTGWILHVETDPGTTAPDDNYGITLKNDNGRDIAGGNLSNRDTANTEDVVIEEYNYGPLTIAVTSAGTSKTAEILIYYLP